MTKYLLRIWISATSVGAFALGWAVLAHSPKPAPLAAQAAEVSASSDFGSLDPVPSLEDLLQGSSVSQQPSFSTQRSFGFSMPRLRTRGS